MEAVGSLIYQNIKQDVELSLEMEMQRSKRQFEKLLRDERIKTLDLSKIDTKRRRIYTPQSSLQVEGVACLNVGSLECEYTEEDELRPSDINADTDFPTSSRALLTYFCALGSPGNTDEIDIKFLDVLCSLGDVNVRDIHGQSILHEVAREWSTGIANYLVLRGMDVNGADKWGRTPLYISVATNDIEMSTWLLENGANINQRTIKGEGQCPIHFAAKYDSLEVFEILLQYGANPEERDDDGRTPFFIAAETGNQRMCKYLLDLELPTASYTNRGESVIDQIISNLPTEIAWRALDQFIAESRTTMFAKYKVYLSCLGKRRWRLLHQNNPHLDDTVIIQPPDPLQIIIKRHELNLIQHPAILELIKLKGVQYGRKWKNVDIVFHLLFTITWTTCASIRVNEFNEAEDEVTASETTKLVVMILATIAQLFTCVYLYKLYIEWCGINQLEKTEDVRVSTQYQRLRPFCHPRWKYDDELLAKKLDTARVSQRQFWSSDGIYNEVACLSLSCVYFFATVVWYIFEEIGFKTVLREARMLLSTVFILVLFLRLNRCFQTFQSFGPFISMIGESVRCGLQIIFLFFEFFAPFSVACWLTFGGALIQPHEKYQSFQNMLYQLWLMSFVGNYEYKALYDVSPIMTQLLVSMYFLLLGIITINIYIALLSEAFARVNESASAKAYMAQAKFIQTIETAMPEYKRNLEVYINKYCAPMEIAKDEFYETYKTHMGNSRGLLKDIHRNVLCISQTMQRMTDVEFLQKRDIQEIRSKFVNFRKRYDEEKLKRMVKELSTIFNGQETSLTKTIMKANRGILAFIAKFSDADIIHK